MKISVIGIGHVGATLAYTLMLRGLGDELVLVNLDREIAEGEALDLRHAGSFTNQSLIIRSGEIADTADSDILIITSSVPWNPEYTSRMEIGRDNLKIFEEIIPPLADASPNAKMLVITNPVDVMTHHAIRLSGFGPRRVFGTGTLVDSGRFRTLLSAEMGVHPDDLRAYILGEHGDSQFPVFSMAVVGGSRIVEDATTIEIFKKAGRSGHEVMSRKGHTNYAISMAAALVVEAIAWDTHRTIPLSVRVDGFLGVNDICLSLPVVIGKDGITRIFHPDLGEEEAAAFTRSVEAVREGIRMSIG